MRGSFENFAV